MATTSNILTLLTYNCTKQKTPMIEYDQFADYIHRYAQHHMDENDELIPYCSADYRDTLQSEINNLLADRQIAITNIRNKDFLFAVPYFIDKYNTMYASIEANVLVPLPSSKDLPKAVPEDILTKIPADEIIFSRLDKEEPSDRYLYAISFSKKLPELLFPSNYKIYTVIKLCLNKLQQLLSKEESHDYFLKKLTISNPGKELSIKTFFNQFCQNPEVALEQLKTTGDTFYYWSQLGYFIKQDYTKLKDFTPEDISILQSVAVIEVATAYYKSRTAERIAVEAALETLDGLMKNPPYYYTMDNVLKLKDKNGIPLLGQYKEEQLKEHLKKMTTESIDNQLPQLLIFKTRDDVGYYIFKERVIPLIHRLANEVRNIIRESLIKSWFSKLQAYDSLLEMHDNAEFELCLEREISAVEPILQGLLDSAFLPVVCLEDQTPGHIMYYRDGQLIPYSEILMISRQEILADAKLRLPFWYTIPVLSYFLKLIFGKNGGKKKKRSKDSVTLEDQNVKKAIEKETFKRRDEDDSIDPLKNRRRELRKAAFDMEAAFVPESSTLDRELKNYMHEWNDRIGKQNYDNLGEDVNSLIRDYMRKVLKTLRADSFNVERVKHLAESLVATPSMMKIKNHPALQRYIELYIISIIKNLKSN